MVIKIDLSSRLIVPRESMNRLSLSCPHAIRLHQCCRWMNSSRDDLEAEVRGANWDGCRQRPADFQFAIDTLHDKLQTLATDPVWLVPSVVGAKLNYTEHLRPFLGSQAQSILGFGLRDTFQNRFKFIWQRGQTPSLLCRPREALATRSFPTIYCTTTEPGRLRGGQATVTPSSFAIDGESDEVELAIVATPLVEDGCITPLQKRLGHQSDLRHEWHLKPSTQWKTDLVALQRILESNDEPEAIGSRILDEANRRQLRVEDGYYLSSVGVRANGDLILISQHSSVTAIAEAQLEAGAVYALLTEEGGSCATALWQNASDFSLPNHVKRDANGNAVWQPDPVIFGNNTYFRPTALAMAVVELNEFVLESPFVE